MNGLIVQCRPCKLQWAKGGIKLEKSNVDSGCTVLRWVVGYSLVGQGPARLLLSGFLKLEVPLKTIHKFDWYATYQLCRLDQQPDPD
jgi:hypothetical protein